MSLTKLLPAPSQNVHDRSDEDATLPSSSQSFQVMAVNMAPPYGHRRAWIPRRQEDFGDGGAFPEIHVAQYPLDMGKEKSQGNALALTLDSQGKIRYDALARAGHAKDRVVHSKFGDLLPKVMDESDPALERPDEDSVEDTAERTRAALDRLVEAKVAASAPVRRAEATGPAQYIRYTPSQQGEAYNSGAKQRVIRMVDTQSDPMEPPKFKINQKIPRGPPSPPPPVLHSPTRKVTVKEQAEWKIPPCISNWKNPKGYTIPLDKRVAADGRGLQTVHINENFAKLAEALYIVDRKAREAVEMRAQIDRKIAQKEKERREEELRRIAQRAREERAGLRGSAAAPGAASSSAAAGAEDEAVVAGAGEEARDRDELRRDRARDRARDRNLARAGADTKNRVQRERDRDISEKIALGLPGRGGGAAGVDAQFDSRLFNQSKGLDSGFNAGQDDAYNVYDKPWRGDREAAQHLYRPGRSAGGQALDDQEGGGYAEELDRLAKARRFVPDREFSGASRASASGAAGARADGPVQFERDQEEDPFGLNDFLRQVKTGGGGGGGGKRGAGDESGGGGGSSSRSKRDRRE